jgi:hypothetical protein
MGGAGSLAVIVAERNAQAVDQTIDFAETTDPDADPSESVRWNPMTSTAS